MKNFVNSTANHWRQTFFLVKFEAGLFLKICASICKGCFFRTRLGDCLSSDVFDVHFEISANQESRQHLIQWQDIQIKTKENLQISVDKSLQIFTKVFTLTVSVVSNSYIILEVFKSCVHLESKVRTNYRTSSRFIVSSRQIFTVKLSAII